MGTELRWTIALVRDCYHPRWRVWMDANGCWATLGGRLSAEQVVTAPVLRAQSPALLAAAIEAHERAPGRGGGRVYHETQAPPGRAHNMTGGA